MSGRLSLNWDKFNVDWIPTLNLGKRIHKQKDVDAATKRAERANARSKRVIEQQENEAARKRQLLDQSGKHVANVDFRGALMSTSSEIVEGHSSEIQPEEPDTGSCWLFQPLERGNPSWIQLMWKKLEASQVFVSTWRG